MHFRESCKLFSKYVLGASKVAVIFNSIPSADESLTVDEANKNHNASIRTFVIATGSNIRKSELYATGSQPSFRHVHFYSSASSALNDVPGIASYLEFKTCEGNVIYNVRAYVCVYVHCLKEWYARTGLLWPYINWH